MSQLEEPSSRDYRKRPIDLLGRPMFKVLATLQELERQGKDIVHFEIGEPDFAMPSNISDAACAAIRNGETHHTSSVGLRLAASDATKMSRRFRPGLSAGPGRLGCT